MPASYTDEEFERRFWDRLDRTGDCWEWTGAKNNRGYGLLRRHNQAILTHRVAYALTHGEVPEGLIVRHRCDNPPCCRPDHLVSGTIADNSQDMLERGRACFREAHWTNLRPETVVRGEERWTSKLTDDQVREIRARYEAGGITQRELGAEFGLSGAQVSRIITRKRWQHLE